MSNLFLNKLYFPLYFRYHNPKDDSSLFSKSSFMQNWKRSRSRQIISFIFQNWQIESNNCSWCTVTGLVFQWNVSWYYGYFVLYSLTLSGSSFQINVRSRGRGGGGGGQYSPLGFLSFWLFFLLCWPLRPSYMKYDLSYMICRPH